MDERTRFEDVVRNSYMGVVWTHKIQEKQTDIFSSEAKTLEIIRLVSSSLTAAGVISLIFESNALWLKIATAVVSFVTIFSEAYSKSLTTQTAIDSHRKTAAQLLELRDGYQYLLLQIKDESCSLDSIKADYEKLEKRKHTLYKEAPRTTDRAVKLAKKALNVNEDNSFSNAEIDNTLPETLRKE